MNQDSFYQEKVAEILKKAKAKGASEVEVGLTTGAGFSVNVRNQELETIEHHEDQSMGITVYFGRKKGSADTSDLSAESMDEALSVACHIAEFTLDDPYSGLADPSFLAQDWPELDLYHPYPHDIEAAILQAKDCEKRALSIDSRITCSEGANFNTYAGVNVYGNSNGFLARTQATSHDLSIGLIAEVKGQKERDHSYSSARCFEDLWPVERIVQDAAKRVLQRLNSRQIPTGKVQVIFEASVAGSLIGAYFKGVSGGNLYRKTTCFLDSLGQQIFPESITLFEDPFVLRGLGSTPFDGEGVAIAPQNLVEKGIVKSYLLGSYSARQLKMQTTGHAGGVRNVFVRNTEALEFQTMLQEMGQGLVVTELIGQGLNLLTGDYSRGVSGFWVENGEVQFPVSEITIAGNLKEMLRNIRSVGADVDVRKRIQTGSIWVGEMMVAGTS
ncbi:MAG: metalloprotease PmbA [Gammaproteobacteria bacterium]|nr:metalloprotease PmbA [Gammaproteobacteria bacterium]